MLSLPIVSLVTPCRDPGPLLDQTILSVAAQAGNFRIRYHVRDYGSSDGTAERLDWWKEQFATGAFPVQCDRIWFSFTSEPAPNRFEALCRGVEAARSGESFLGWLDPGDRLLPGALGLVADVAQRFSPDQLSWLSGAAAGSQTPLSRQDTDIPIPRMVLRAGLCDGVHWEPLQSAGSFFRPWLWDRTRPARRVQALEKTSDWSIWRQFAELASPVQTRFALATSPQRAADDVLAEIDTLLPQAARREALEALCAEPALTRRVLDGPGIRPESGPESGAGDASDLTLSEESATGHLAACYGQVFGHPAPSLPEDRAAHVLFRAKPRIHQAFAPLGEVVSLRGNILAYDGDWQYPAITEQHAFTRLQALGAIPDGVTYVAYPWATLIDKLHRKTPDSGHLLDRFRAFCAALPENTVRITVCQHIKMKEALHLFRECGISEIFWSHTTREDIARAGHDGITLRPFPLFPVQVCDQQVAGSGERPYLFSFIGARANRHYLTESRNWILDLLADHPRGWIVGRDQWHYNKVVYDHQVRHAGASAHAAHRLVDRSASEQFRASLLDSVFALCPSGSGPNSIRLWESLGAGTVPVILADSYAPPGDPALWQAAAVFCRERPEDIRALPARLEEIAADPGRLATMRHAGRQLWMLYGPDCFVYDIQKALLDVPAAGAAGPGEDGSGLLPELARSLSRKQDLSEGDAVFLLQGLGSDLLLRGTEARVRQDRIPGLPALVGRVRTALGEDHPALRRFDAVLTHTGNRDLGAPGLNARGRMRVCLFGKHSNRTPLSYAPFRALAADRVEFTEDPRQADVVLSGFNADLRDEADAFAGIARGNPGARMVILSEEPLWDSIWSGDFTARSRVSEAGLAYTFLNHANTAIFDFDQIPYFLLTNEDFQARYGLLIARHAGLTPRALLDHWQAAPVPAAFFAEYRDNPAYDKSFPDQKVTGLSVYRTRVAETVQSPGTLRVGRGWQAQALRQDLPDWHLDKLAALDMRVRVLASYENTHQHAYVSEKIFDAFVTGSIPTYFADPDHRIFCLVPETAMINTHGLGEQAAAGQIAGFTPGTEFAEAWLDTARALQQRFSDLDGIARERRRVVDAVLDELEACLSGAAAA